MLLRFMSLTFAMVFCTDMQAVGRLGCELFADDLSPLEQFNKLRANINRDSGAGWEKFSVDDGVFLDRLKTNGVRVAVLVKDGRNPSGVRLVVGYIYDASSDALEHSAIKGRSFGGTKRSAPIDRKLTISLIAPLFEEDTSSGYVRYESKGWSKPPPNEYLKPIKVENITKAKFYRDGR